MAEWFYTTNKQQMGPVTWDELRELAEVGILKPHDLIWTEGMEEWVKGINQPGLFAEGPAESVSAGKQSSYAAPKPPPGRRSRRKEEVDDDEEDEKDAKKKSRKKQEERAKMAVGLKVGLILGAVVFALLFLVCAGVGLVGLTVGFGGGGEATIAPYAIHNLQERQHVDKRFNFKQDQRLIITVNNNRPNMNVALMVFRGNDLNNPIQRVQQVNQTCRAELILPMTDSYTVRVANFGPGIANTLNVTIDTR